MHIHVRLLRWKLNWILFTVSLLAIIRFMFTAKVETIEPTKKAEEEEVNFVNEAGFQR